MASAFTYAEQGNDMALQIELERIVDNDEDKWWRLAWNKVADKLADR